MCKHEARKFVDGKIVTDRLNARAAAVAWISAGAGRHHSTWLRHQSKRTHSRGGSYFSNPENTDAKAIVFSCGYSSYPVSRPRSTTSLRSARNTRYGYRLQRTSQIEYGSGNDGTRRVGVLICCCPEDECEHGGSPRVKARMKALTHSLERLDIDPKRLQVVEVPREIRRNSPARRRFMKDIRSIGPLV